MAPKARCKVVAYYRVSTEGQGKSGLGLESQEASVKAQAEAMGCTIVASFTEVESGKRDDRPELAKALAHAKRSKATLVVAKLDRLTRSLRMLLEIMDSNVDVLFCDLPAIPGGAMGKFVVSLMAALAEMEAGIISERTTAGLAAYKARGGLLGGSRPECRNLTPEARQRGVKTAAARKRAATTADYADLIPVAKSLRADGLTLQGIADRLNADGHTTRSGGPWGEVQVLRLLRRDLVRADKQGGE